MSKEKRFRAHSAIYIALPSHVIQELLTKSGGQWGSSQEGGGRLLILSIGNDGIIQKDHLLSWSLVGSVLKAGDGIDSSSG